MRRIWMVLATACLLATFASAQQSLADLARAARKDKRPPAKVYTNDDLPKDTAISVAGQPAADDKSASAGTAATDTSAPADDAKKMADDYRKQIADAKKAVADLTHEIDLMQREEKLRQAIFYADAGNRLRDDKKWSDDERKYQADLADRQQKLDDAKKKLDDLRDQGRKAGVPASVLE
jgi:hypothetical protein